MLPGLFFDTFRLMLKIVSKTKQALIGFYLNQTEKTVPIDTVLKPMVIGWTIDGQEIKYYKSGHGPARLLMLGGIHGNEIGTVKLLHRLINWLCQSQNQIFTFYFIPCLNLDGYKKALKNPDYWGGGRVGRVNANNVDLNRNFDVPSFHNYADWTHGKNYQESTEVFAGLRGNSEPETQALTNFIKKENIKIVLSFHNAGADIVGNLIDPAEKLAKIFSRISDYRYISPEEWQKFGQTGSSYEWCTLNKIALLEIEASNRYGSDWARQKPAIKMALNEIAKDIKF